MNERQLPVKRPCSDEVHLAIYVALVGTAIWFAIVIWGFASDSYTGWLLAVVSAFALIAVAIPAILSRVGHDHRNSNDQRFRDWAAGDFASWTDRSKAANAAIEILLPLGAVVVGMTAIVIVYIAEHA